MADILPLKCYLETNDGKKKTKEIRRMVLESDAEGNYTYPMLREKVCGAYSQLTDNSFTFYYTDEENEKVIISCNDDLQNAFKYAKGEDTEPFKLIIRLQKSSAGNQPPEAPGNSEDDGKSNNWLERKPKRTEPQPNQSNLPECLTAYWNRFISFFHGSGSFSMAKAFRRRVTEDDEENHQPQVIRETNKDEEKGCELTLLSDIKSNPESRNISKEE